MSYILLGQNSSILGYKIYFYQFRVKETDGGFLRCFWYEKESKVWSKAARKSYKWIAWKDWLELTVKRWAPGNVERMFNGLSSVDRNNVPHCLLSPDTGQILHTKLHNCVDVFHRAHYSHKRREGRQQLIASKALILRPSLEILTMRARDVISMLQIESNAQKIAQHLNGGITSLPEKLLLMVYLMTPV